MLAYVYILMKDTRNELSDRPQTSPDLSFAVIHLCDPTTIALLSLAAAILRFSDAALSGISLCIAMRRGTSGRWDSRYSPKTKRVTF
jgi:hypothetical protein